MKKKDLETIVKEQFKKLKHKEGIVTIDKDKNEYNIQYGANGIFVNIYLRKKKMIWDNVYLDNDLRGKGLGRKIVEIGEYIAKQTKMKEGEISLNTNPSFWEHMGYNKDVKKYK